MLSSPSLLVSALSSLSVAGDAAPAAGDAAPGFAELLNGLAAKATEAVSSEKTGAKPAVADEATPLAKGKTITVRAGRLAIAAKAAIADGKEAPTMVAAAIESGKILPVALPEAAAADGQADAGLQTVITEATAPAAVPVVPGTFPLPPVPTGDAEPALAAATTSRRPAAVARQTLTHTVNPAASRPTDKHAPEAPAVETRPAAAVATPAVAITVAAPVQIAASEAVETGAKPAASVRSKPARGADLARIEVPLLQVPGASSAVPQFAPADPTAQAANAPAPSVAAPLPSPTDIDATLDHLVAAREALMPAEAALAIDHAEFGEVSIKFEQSSDGRLSAELASADPELQRAVTAAVAADRGAATASNGDGGRPTHMANHRGSTAGGDTAQGDRAQSGGERELPQRRASSRPQTRQGATDRGPGVFA